VSGGHLTMNRGASSPLFRVVDDIVVDEHPALKVLHAGRCAERRSGFPPGGDMKSPQHEQGPQALTPSEGEFFQHPERLDRGVTLGGPSSFGIGSSDLLLYAWEPFGETLELHVRASTAEYI
jgi:hypothetical protein